VSRVSPYLSPPLNISLARSLSHSLPFFLILTHSVCMYKRAINTYSVCICLDVYIHYMHKLLSFPLYLFLYVCVCVYMYVCDMWRALLLATPRWECLSHKLAMPYLCDDNLFSVAQELHSKLMYLVHNDCSSPRYVAGGWKIHYPLSVRLKGTMANGRFNLIPRPYSKLRSEVTFVKRSAGSSSKCKMLV
jgi:hypothetical protein